MILIILLIPGGSASSALSAANKALETANAAKDLAQNANDASNVVVSTVQNAKAAADAANAAASLAQSATKDASDATNAVKTVIQSANAAANSAQSATKDARDTTVAANNAVLSAKNAASAANTAAITLSSTATMVTTNVESLKADVSTNSANMASLNNMAVSIASYSAQLAYTNAIVDADWLTTLHSYSVVSGISLANDKNFKDILSLDDVNIYINQAVKAQEAAATALEILRVAKKQVQNITLPQARTDMKLSISDIENATVSAESYALASLETSYEVLTAVQNIKTQLIASREDSTELWEFLNSQIDATVALAQTAVTQASNVLEAAKNAHDLFSVQLGLINLVVVG